MLPQESLFCKECETGPTMAACSGAEMCSSNRFYAFKEKQKGFFSDQEETKEEARMDTIGQNGNDGLHYQEAAKQPSQAEPSQAKTSDGSTASYYELPAGAKELQDLISHRDMNAQMGEIFRACYRYGQVAHSPRLRDIKKIIFYALAELDRLERLQHTLRAMPAPGTLLPAKILDKITYKEGGPWVDAAISGQLVAVKEVPNMKLYAAARFTDGSVYDYILKKWR